jgi:hypothetical protein
MASKTCTFQGYEEDPSFTIELYQEKGEGTNLHERYIWRREIWMYKGFRVESANKRGRSEYTGCSASHSSEMSEGTDREGNYVRYSYQTMRKRYSVLSSTKDPALSHISRNHRGLLMRIQSGTNGRQKIHQSLKYVLADCLPWFIADQLRIQVEQDHPSSHLINPNSMDLSPSRRFISW